MLMYVLLLVFKNNNKSVLTVLYLTCFLFKTELSIKFTLSTDSLDFNILCSNLSQVLSTLLEAAMLSGKTADIFVSLPFSEVRFACSLAVKSEYKYEETLVCIVLMTE